MAKRATSDLDPKGLGLTADGSDHDGAERRQQFVYIHDDFASHPWVSEQFFLAVPRRLLEFVEAKIHPPPWDNQARQLERHAGALLEERGNAVGFWSGLSLLNDDLLPPLPLPSVSAEDAKALGWEWNEEQTAERLRVGQIRIDYFASVGRGYAGWLVTCDQFQREQAELIRRWSDEIRRLGLCGVGRLISGRAPDESLFSVVNPADREQQFVQAVRHFLVRWRLNELTAPNVPAPAKPLMAGMFPLTVSNHLMEMGGVFHIPDTYPIPSRDELRAMLDESLHSASDATHLKEWHEIVGAGNSAKNQIESYARVRQVYHFWALLHDRYDKNLAGKVERLSSAFADYFEVSEETIRRDLRLIGQRLGPEWPTSGCFQLAGA